MALIDIGVQKQLFFDDYLIESLAHTRQVMNPAAKVESNPILRPERPWEGNDVRLGRVIFDEREQRFRMWYSARTFNAARGENEITVSGEGDSVTCLATSEDGIQWDRPVLGFVEFQGSRANNILPRESLMPYWFLDTHEDDPAKRYKGLRRRATTGAPGMQIDLYYSPDASRWTPYEDNPVIDTSPRTGRWGPTSLMGWDPIRRVYAVHMENCAHQGCPIGKRLIGRAESPDMIHWSAAETILVPDAHDPSDTEFYAMPVIAYEGIYVGLLWIFSTTNTTHHPQVVFSRDGVHYNRDYREPFIPRGATADFDSTSLYANAPLVRGDRILTYYTGTNWRSPETLFALGEKAVAAAGLAVTPLDGFVSLDGSRTETSEMVTRSFSFAGSRLYLNVRSALQQWGAGPCDVRVEILGPNHDRLPGFSVEDADVITASGQAHVASWKGKRDLSEFAGKPVKLRFCFQNAKLFSFRFK